MIKLPNQSLFALRISSRANII